MIEEESKGSMQSDSSLESSIEKDWDEEEEKEPSKRDSPFKQLSAKKVSGAYRDFNIPISNLAIVQEENESAYSGFFSRGHPHNR